MIDYVSITQKIHDLLDNGLTAEVFIEPENIGITFGAEVGISMTGEENSERTIGNDDPYLSVVLYSIICSEYSPDGVLESCKKRDALVGSVRDLLKTDRTLGGAVASTQLGDTKFETAAGNAGFYSAAILTLRVYLIS